MRLICNHCNSNSLSLIKASNNYYQCDNCDSTYYPDTLKINNNTGDKGMRLNYTEELQKLIDNPTDIRAKIIVLSNELSRFKITLPINKLPELENKINDWFVKNGLELQGTYNLYCVKPKRKSGGGAYVEWNPLGS